jgi:hypothetical protein
LTGGASGGQNESPGQDGGTSGGKNGLPGQNVGTPDSQNGSPGQNGGTAQHNCRPIKYKGQFLTMLDRYIVYLDGNELVLRTLEK